MSLEVVLSCPLGHRCEEAREGKVHRCAWFIKLVGTNPSTGAQIDEHGCAMAWTPLLLVENAGALRSNAAAIESFRNEMKSDNQSLMTVLPQTIRPALEGN
jgi:hypothetical protein